MEHKDVVLMRRSRQPSEEIEDLAYQVIGAAVEVHKLLGPGFAESVYEQALCHELGLRQIVFTRQVPIVVRYKGQTVGEGRMDLLISGSLVIELKAIDELASVHTAQVISYLKATGHQLGLLINFNVPILKAGIRRVINT